MGGLGEGLRYLCLQGGELGGAGGFRVGGLSGRVADGGAAQGFWGGGGDEEQELAQLFEPGGGFPGESNTGHLVLRGQLAELGAGAHGYGEIGEAEQEGVVVVVG